MVFCGRPSKGCASCRKRRIKCDQIRPACSQCLRSKKECEGYRDLLDLSFRNENEKTAGKARHQPETAALAKKHRKDVAATSPLHIPSKSNENVLQAFQQLVLLHATPAPRAIQHDYLDEGVNFFVKTFVGVLLDDQSHRKTRISINQIIPWGDMYESKSLFNAVSSVGYAGLGNVTKDPKYTILARKRFSVALTTVTAALKNPVKENLESVFKSVLLMSAFQLVSDPLCTNQDWSIHVEGGAALLELTDAKRSRDIPIRQQLKICLAIFSQYINKKQACSPAILNWCKTCSESIDSDDFPAITLTRLLIQFTNLNAAIGRQQEPQQSPSPNSTSTAALIAEVIALDAHMELWEKTLPEAWSYKVVPKPQPQPQPQPQSQPQSQSPSHPKETETNPPSSSSGIFTEQFLIYRDLWTARIWNDYRWVRICINDLIIRQLFARGFLDAADMAQVCKSLRVNATMSRGISHSISVQYTSRKTTTQAGSFVLLHPLVVAASGIGVPPAIYQFALDKLNNMGHKLGIGKALSLAEAAIKQRKEWKDMLTEWLEVNSSVGCVELRVLAGGYVDGE